MSPTPTRAMTISTTIIALIAFAANSVLCRMALLEGNIDAASFTVVRIVSGVVTLAVLVALRNPGQLFVRPNWAAGLALFAYMVLFCLAYIALGAGSGALVLFGFVQLTMMSMALLQKEPFPPLAWLGLAVSVAEVLRNSNPRMKGRAITGQVNFEQIPELAERGRHRIELFYATIEQRLNESAFLALDHPTLADITAFVVIDFMRVVKMLIPEGNTATLAWFANIKARPSAAL